MSKNGGPTGDQRILAALHQTGGVWRVVVAQRANGDGVLTLLDSREFPRSEHGHIDTFLDQHQAGRVIVALPAGSVICRTVELPNADEEHLAPALALQMETFLSEAAPPHRRGMAVLDRAEGETTRSGLLTAWPARATRPETPTERHVDFASDIAGVAALVNGVRPPDPVMWVDQGSESVALALAHSQGVAFRAAREPSADPSEWRAGVNRLLAETAYNHGHSEAYTDNVIAGIESWVSNIPNGSGRLHLPREIRDGARRRLQGASDDTEWWEKFGVACGVLLAATGTLGNLTTLQDNAPIEQPTVVDRLCAVLGTRKAAAFWLIAALVLIGMGPLTFSGLRLFTLYAKVGDLDEYKKADAVRKSRLDIYRELEKNTWSMSKLITDIGNCAPPHVVFGALDLDETGNKVEIRGEVTLDGNRVRPESQRLVLAMKDKMVDTGIFRNVTHTYSERDSSLRSQGSNAPQFTIHAEVADAFRAVDWGHDDYAKSTLLVRLYPEAARDASPPDEDDSDAPLGNVTRAPDRDPEDDEDDGAASFAPPRVADAGGQGEEDDEGFGRTGPRSNIRPRANIPSIASEDPEDRGPRVPPSMTADEIGEMDRAQTIAAMVQLRNAMKLPRLSEEQKTELKDQFNAMATHLRNLREN